MSSLIRCVSGALCALSAKHVDNRALISKRLVGLLGSPAAKAAARAEAQAKAEAAAKAKEEAAQKQLAELKQADPEAFAKLLEKSGGHHK